LSLKKRVDELERRLKVLEDDKAAKEELIKAAFEPPPRDRPSYSRDEVEQSRKLHT